MAVVCSAFAGGACVSKSKYRALEKELATSQTLLGAELETRSQRIATLEQALAAERAAASKLEADLAGSKVALANTEAQLAAKSAELERTQAERSRTEGELAAVVKDRARLKASAAELQQAIAELSKRKAQADARVAQFRALLDRFKTMIDAGKLRVRIVDGRMVLQLPTDVLFASGKASLSPDGKAAIAEIAAVLAAIPERQFQVEGHTDNVPIQTARYPSNWDLAAARALVVVAAMTGAGVDGSRLSAASYGEFHPVASNESDQGRAENRRIEIVLLPDLTNLPGFEELSAAVAGSSR